MADPHSKMMKRVEKNPLALKQATADLPPDARPQALWRYRQVATKAIKIKWEALEYASADLKDDREFVLEAVKVGGWRALQHASAKVRGNRKFMLMAVKQSWQALQYASADLKEDRELVAEALKQHEDALEHASPKLQGDQEIVQFAQVLRSVWNTWPVVLQQPQPVSNGTTCPLRGPRIIHGGIKQANAMLFHSDTCEPRWLQHWYG